MNTAVTFPGLPDGEDDGGDNASRPDKSPSFLASLRHACPSCSLGWTPLCVPRAQRRSPRRAPHRRVRRALTCKPLGARRQHRHHRGGRAAMLLITIRPRFLRLPRRTARLATACFCAHCHSRRLRVMAFVSLARRVDAADTSGPEVRLAARVRPMLVAFTRTGTFRGRSTNGRPRTTAGSARRTGPSWSSEPARRGGRLTGRLGSKARERADPASAPQAAR
jgi:hypothetical protein